MAAVTLNPLDCDLSIDLSSDRLTATPLSQAGFGLLWSGARATVGIQAGRYYFRVKNFNGHSPWQSSMLSPANKVEAACALQPYGACEVIMLVGLPGAGKSIWAKGHVDRNPDKRYLVLGTNAVMEAMRSALGECQNWPLLMSFDVLSV
ncbi:hypothetical protein WJX84_005651 [Apatococcus fuscideae]|uniref:Uncharacterized protein n=1 Tax=Apatococcus fuscideae TaxID=2026836 RepID=A0AAW1SPQ7_9CHLO